MKFIELTETFGASSKTRHLINPSHISFIKQNVQDAAAKETKVIMNNWSLTVDQTPAEIMAMIREAEADSDHHSPAPDADARKRIAELEAEIAALRIRAEKAESALEEAREEEPVLDKIRVLKTAKDVLYAEYEANTKTYYGGLCDAADEVVGRCIYAIEGAHSVRPYHVK